MVDDITDYLLVDDITVMLLVDDITVMLLVDDISVILSLATGAYDLQLQLPGATCQSSLVQVCVTLTTCTLNQQTTKQQMLCMTQECIRTDGCWRYTLLYSSCPF